MPQSSLSCEHCLLLICYHSQHPDNKSGAQHPNVDQRQRLNIYGPSCVPQRHYCFVRTAPNHTMSTGQCNAPSAPFSRWNYFVACWSRSEPVYQFLRRVAWRFHFLKALVLKLGKIFGGRLFPKIKKRALLIGIEHDDDPTTLALTGPHRDVRSLRQLLISK